MKIKFLFSTSLVLTFLSSTLIGGVPEGSGGKRRGPEGSGGSDDFRPVSAWFRTDDGLRAVKACYEVASDFGVSAEELTEIVKISFGKWGSYLTEKNLIQQISSKSYKIATALDLRAFCQGDEDLKFYFGTENAKVKRAKDKYEKPFGFAELNLPEVIQKPWGTGFIWIANSKSLYPQKGIPSWGTSKESLQGLILHELGHVFGNGHVDDTIMTADLAKYLVNDTRPDVKQMIWPYSSIDSLIELVPCFDCKVSYQAPSESHYLLEAYQFLEKRNPVGTFTATFNRDGLRSQELVFRDEAGESRFSIQLRELIASQRDSARLFLGLGNRYFFSEGRSYLGEIQTQNGSKVPVVVSYNMNSRKLTVKALVEGMQSQLLFVH